MSSLNPSKIKAYPEYFFLGLVYLVIVLIHYTIYILLPYWSGDEYTYKSIALGIWHFGRAGVLTSYMVGASVNIPDLLYPYLISPAFLLGENFYFGIRLINAIVMTSAIFPCYWLARKFLEPKVALFAAAVSVLIPFMDLGAYAVTEVLFFPILLCFICNLIASIDHPFSIWRNVCLGVLLAILLNTRLNALILIPAYFIILLWIALWQKTLVSLLKKPYWLIVIGTFGITHIFLQYILNVDVIGGLGLYGTDVVYRSGQGLAFVITHQFKDIIIYLLTGHLTILSIPYALPLALIIMTLLSKRAARLVGNNFYTFLIVAIVCFLALFLLSIGFTIKVSPFDLGGLKRWHARYYFYAYPLLIIPAFVFAKHYKQFIPNSIRLGVYIIVGLLLAVNIYFIKIQHGIDEPWFGNSIGNMDLQWYLVKRSFYWPFIIFTIIVAYSACQHKTYFNRWAICYVIIWLIVANYGAFKQSLIGPIMKNDRCGNLSQIFLQYNPGTFIIVGSSRSEIVATAFWNTFIPIKTVTYDSNPDFFKDLIQTTPLDYVILDGDIQISSSYSAMFALGNCRIYKRTTLIGIS